MTRWTTSSASHQTLEEGQEAHGNNEDAEIDGLLFGDGTVVYRVENLPRRYAQWYTQWYTQWRSHWYTHCYTHWYTSQGHA